MSDLPTRPGTDEEWESLLRQLRTRPAQPRPFFYSRVRARLVDGMTVERPLLPTWLRWPSYALMLGTILLLSGDGAALRPDGGARSYQLYPANQPVELPAR